MGSSAKLRTSHLIRLADHEDHIALLGDRWPRQRLNWELAHGAVS